MLLGTCCAAQQVMDPNMHHLRSGAEREWDDFPSNAEGKELTIYFRSSKNSVPHTLRLRQRDVKQAWSLRLNDKKIGLLLADEKDTVIYLPLPQGALRDGDNELKISCDGGAALASDDIEIGDIAILPTSSKNVLSESSLDVQVIDTATNSPTPSRITIVDANGSLAGIGPAVGAAIAARPGVVYTGDGKAHIPLPAGQYTLYAGRGFEYSLDSAQIDLKPGETIEKNLKISRTVQTPGYVSCDTHIHTLTYSRHGDATLEERMITLAGENIELAIATDHNLQIDYTESAKKLGVDKYFTSVIGNEVTTAAQGHFNIFPIAPNSKLINFRAANWDTLATSIAEIASADPIIILNHARDIHGGFRPHDPSRFLALTGQRLDGRKLPANAMEVINSGAIMSDPMRLYNDWFGLLNRGQKLTPVGASDSHDVSRYIVGQARTYIRCDDSDPGHINIDQARKNFLAGKVLISYGLLTDLTINNKFHPGDLVPATGPLEIDITVQSPPWSRPSHLTLFANGLEIKSAEFPPSPGRQWQTHFTLPKPKHDLHLVALATGPGIAEPYWQTAKPYQPTSSKFTSYVLGSSGAVFIDADDNGRFDSAFDYAKQILEETKADPAAIAAKLKDYSAHVAVQAASLLQERYPDKFEAICKMIMNSDSHRARFGFENYINAMKESHAAQAAQEPPVPQ